MQDAGQGFKQAVMTPSGRFISITEAANSYGVSRQTIYNRLKKNPAYYYINDEVS
jgi:predicted DNA-binding transcriptional regulator AlpA